jgi:hypothetical protein
LNTWPTTSPSSSSHPARTRTASSTCGICGAEHRIGFLHQKLAEPRSFDFGLLADKPWNDRLRMPQFQFSAEEREAIMTFVLGLVAQPPRPRYVHQPDRQQPGVIEGRKILDEYNCRGCHALRAAQWQIEFPRRRSTHKLDNRRFPVRRRSARTAGDRGVAPAGSARPADRPLFGQPLIGDDGRPMVFDDYGDELFDDEQYDIGALEYVFQLWEPAALEGHEYQVGEAPLYLLASSITAQSPSDGGFLTNYLLPHVVRRQRETNPNAKGSEAWGWLPPVLHGLGRVSRRLDARLPAGPVSDASCRRHADAPFAMSPLEADRLARYFAAVDGVDERRDAVQRRDTLYLQQAEQAYQQRLQELGRQTLATGSRFDHALRIVPTATTASPATSSATTSRRPATRPRRPIWRACITVCARTGCAAGLPSPFRCSRTPACPSTSPTTRSAAPGRRRSSPVPRHQHRATGRPGRSAAELRQLRHRRSGVRAQIQSASFAAEHEIRRTDLSFHAAAFRDNSCDEDA